jgi:hypothetical protein
MLLPVYNQIKQTLTAITAIKLIDWFNAQYDGIIHTSPCIFIEFPEQLNFQTLSRDVQQAELKIGIHLVSKVMSAQDKSIDEASIAAHDVNCNEIYKLIQGKRDNTGDWLQYNSLNRTGYRHYHDLQGWFVTVQDFECMIYQKSVKDMITIARPEVVVSSHVTI